jgi:2,3-dihydroxybenzoate-AMP ligase
MVARTVARLPDKVALVAGERRETYADLDRASARLGAALLRQGIRPLDRVVVQLPNTPEFVHWYLALVRIGAIPVLALRAHRHTEVRHFIRASGAVAYVVPDVAHHFDYRPMATQMQGDAPACGCLWWARPATARRRTPRCWRASPTTKPPQRFGPPSHAVDPADVATMLLSGGTTSLSKLIPRTHEDYVLNARLCGRAGASMSRRCSWPSCRWATTTTWPRRACWAPSTRRHRGAGASGDTAEDLPPGRAREGHRDRAVVPLISAWLASGFPKRFDHVLAEGGAERRRAPGPGAAPAPDRELGCTPQEIYGTAEGLINMTRWTTRWTIILLTARAPGVRGRRDRGGGRRRPGGARRRGRRADHARALHHPGLLPGAGEEGRGLHRRRLLPHGRHRAQMGPQHPGRGPAQGPDQPRRREDQLRRGRELHPPPPGKVKSACLVAMPDPVFGEKACAFVILREGESLGFESLIAFLRAQQIASFKLPERLEVVSAVPPQPGGQDPQARTARRHRGPARRRKPLKRPGDTP